MNLNKTYKQHQREVKRAEEKIGICMVGRKYFKKNSPNFLTYNEKEQIRILYIEDSDKWTIDKLSRNKYEIIHHRQY